MLPNSWKIAVLALVMALPVANSALGANLSSQDRHHPAMVPLLSKAHGEHNPDGLSEPGRGGERGQTRVSNTLPDETSAEPSGGVEESEAGTAELGLRWRVGEGQTGEAGAKARKLRVAIIGAGASGSSTAYHLRKYVEQLKGCSEVDGPVEVGLDVTVFERRDYVGGRAATADIFGDPEQPTEMGGSVFIRENPTLVRSAEDLGVEAVKPPERPKPEPELEPELEKGGSGWIRNPFRRRVGKVGFWDGAGIVWRFSSVADGLLRWGVLKPAYVSIMVKDTMAKFKGIYTEKHFPWTHPKDAFEAVGLGSLLEITGKDWFVKTKTWGGYAFEGVQMFTRTNYLQNVHEITALGTAVSLAISNPLVIKGGNRILFAEMLRYSGADVKLGVEVISVRRDRDSGRLAVSWEEWASGGGDGSGGERQDLFDVLVVAAPFYQTGVQFEPGVIGHSPIEADFVNLHSTAFSARISRFNSSFFERGASEGVPAVPLSVFSILPEECKSLPSGQRCAVNGHDFDRFNVILPSQTAVNPATGESQTVWKVFSRQRLSARFFTDLLGQADVHTPKDEDDNPPLLDWVARREWLSYPYLVPRAKFDPVQLDDGPARSGSGSDSGEGSLVGSVWYPNSMELFMSTMETSALAGKNVARQIMGQVAGDRERCLKPVSV